MGRPGSRAASHRARQAPSRRYGARRRAGSGSRWSYRSTAGRCAHARAARTEHGEVPEVLVEPGREADQARGHDGLGSCCVAEAPPKPEVLRHPDVAVLAAGPVLAEHPALPGDPLIAFVREWVVRPREPVAVCLPGVIEGLDRQRLPDAEPEEEGVEPRNRVDRFAALGINRSGDVTEPLEQPLGGSDQGLRPRAYGIQRRVGLAAAITRRRRRQRRLDRRRPVDAEGEASGRLPRIVPRR